LTSAHRQFGSLSTIATCTRQDAHRLRRAALEALYSVQIGGFSPPMIGLSILAEQTGSAIQKQDRK
jgi:hypothetical protein